MQLVEIGRKAWVFRDPTITYEIQQKLDRALDTWEAGHVESAKKMLRAIIEECPNHIDACHHLSLIYEEQGRKLEAYVFCQTAVSIGLQAIPKKFKWEQSIVTWGLLNNRPFLRAYHNLGLWHFHNDRYDDAIEIFERLLFVNPDDNQRVRYLLPICWFEKGELSATLDLCRQYSNDLAPAILYSQALAFALLGRDEDARAVLKNCVLELPLVGKELLKKIHPKPKFQMDGYITLGGHDQAYEYWRCFGKYWSDSESAMKLLRQAMKR